MHRSDRGAHATVKRVALTVASVATFLFGLVLAAQLLIWLSVGGTPFRGERVRFGTVLAMAVLGVASAACVYVAVRVWRSRLRV